MEFYQMPIEMRYRIISELPEDKISDLNLSNKQYWDMYRIKNPDNPWDPSINWKELFFPKHSFFSTGFIAVTSFLDLVNRVKGEELSIMEGLVRLEIAPDNKTSFGLYTDYAPRTDVVNLFDPVERSNFPSHTSGSISVLVKLIERTGVCLYSHIEEDLSYSDQEDEDYPEPTIEEWTKPERDEDEDMEISQEELDNLEEPDCIYDDYHNFREPYLSDSITKSLEMIGDILPFPEKYNYERMNTKCKIPLVDPHKIPFVLFTNRHVDINNIKLVNFTVYVKHQSMTSSYEKVGVWDVLVGNTIVGIGIVSTCYDPSSSKTQLVSDGVSFVSQTRWGYSEQGDYDIEIIGSD